MLTVVQATMKIIFDCSAAFHSALPPHVNAYLKIMPATSRFLPYLDHKEEGHLVNKTSLKLLLLEVFSSGQDWNLP